MTDTGTVKTVVSHSRPAAPRHSLLEDIVAIAIASYVVSLGLYFLHEANTVTGGTAGVALVISALTGAPFGLMLFVVNVPFYALAVWKKGAAFTTRTIIAVTVVSALSSLHPAMIGHLSVAVPYATVTGSILLGLGLMMLFRHGASLGGFNVIALLAQERLGWRAGNVQLAMDAVVVLCAFTFADLWTVLWSAVGVAVLNLILTMNHRPGRYMGT